MTSMKIFQASYPISIEKSWPFVKYTWKIRYLCTSKTASKHKITALFWIITLFLSTFLHDELFNRMPVTLINSQFWPKLAPIQWKERKNSYIYVTKTTHNEINSSPFLYRPQYLALYYTLYYGIKTLKLMQVGSNLEITFYSN